MIKLSLDSPTICINKEEEHLAGPVSMYQCLIFCVHVSFNCRKILLWSHSVLRNLAHSLIREDKLQDAMVTDTPTPDLPAFSELTSIYNRAQSG